MRDETITVACCVLNEVTSIGQLMDSILAQSRPPDEILVIDGGSHDGTLQSLTGYASRDSRVRVVSAPGTNIAQARNRAFQEAKGSVVASIDGGCIARPDWLAQLLGRLSDDVDIVSGVYVADPKSDWESVMADFFYPDSSRLPDDWNEPSHCSVLIRKRVWETVGPIPERLYRSEDSWFNSAATAAGFRFRVARDAVVHRRPRQTVLEVVRNTAVWVQSDIENEVNTPHELRRAARLTFRLDAKMSSFALWLGACAFSIPAGVLTFPLLVGILIKASHRMRSVRYVFLYNTVDYLVMLATAWGLFSGLVRRADRRPKIPTPR